MDISFEKIKKKEQANGSKQGMRIEATHKKHKDDKRQKGEKKMNLVGKDNFIQNHPVACHSIFTPIWGD